MAHAQKPDLVFQRNGRVHLNRRGCQFSRLLVAEECGSADSHCTDRVLTYSARLLATHSIHIFPLHFPSHASPCTIRFYTHKRDALVALHTTWSYTTAFSIQVCSVAFSFVNRAGSTPKRNLPPCSTQVNKTSDEISLTLWRLTTPTVVVPHR